MARSPRRPHLLFAGAGLLFALAITSVAVPVISYARTDAREGIVINDGPQPLSLSAGTTYGIFVEDTDNSGYSEQCSLTDPAGHEVAQHDPGWNVSGSDTETLDIVFDSGGGQVVATCAISAERVTVRPVGNGKAVALGVLLAAVLGGAGVVLLVMGARPRPGEAPIAPMPMWPVAQRLPPPAWYPDPQGLQQWRWWDGQQWTEHVHG